MWLPVTRLPSCAATSSAHHKQRFLQDLSQVMSLMRCPVISPRLSSPSPGAPAAQKFKLGVPIRDMRLLDPNLLTSETGKVLVRDNAIVFSMEHARLIITADCVIIPQSGFDHSPLAQHFATLLEEHISEAAQEVQVGPCWAACLCEALW